MNYLKERAEVYRIGLHCDYFTKEDILAWADKEILESEVPDYTLIELSLMSKDDKNFALVLQKVGGTPNSMKVICTFLKMCKANLDLGRRTIYDTISALDWLLSVPNLEIDEEIKNNIHYLSDSYYLATAGSYGDINTVSDEVILFLTTYSKSLNSMKLVFLDIDGVLNTDRAVRLQRLNNQTSFDFDKEAMGNLKAIIDQTDAEIVISSTWRIHYQTDAMLWTELVRNFQELTCKIASTQ